MTPVRIRRRLLNRVAGHGNDDGAVAVITSLVFLFVIVPLLAGVTSIYIKTGTANELQDSGDQGALAGAAIIPLLSPSAAVAYINATDDNTASGILNGVVSQYGLNLGNDSDPLATAEAECNEQANGQSGLGDSTNFSVGSATCSASYLTDNSLLGSVTGCLTSAETAVDTATTSTVALASEVAHLPAPVQAAVKAALAVPGKVESQLSPIVEGLADITPMLAHPGIKVTVTRTVKGPFDAAIGAAPQLQTKVSYARQQIKNLIVLPEVNLPASLTAGGSGIGLGTGVDISLNANPTAQQLHDAVDQILATYASSVPLLTNTVSSQLNSALNGVLGGVTSLIPGASDVASTVTGLTNSLESTATACEGIIGGLQDDIDQLVDPPAYGPDTLAAVNDLTDGEPLTVVKIGSTLGIPFLDVTTCTKGQNLVQNVTDLVNLTVTPPTGPPAPPSITAAGSTALNCTANTTGAERSVLAGS